MGLRAFKVQAYKFRETGKRVHAPRNPAPGIQGAHAPSLRPNPAQTYTGLASLRNPVSRMAALVTYLGLAGAGASTLGGCNLSFSLGSLMGTQEPEHVGSIARAPSPLDPLLDAEDWRRAQAALSLAVDPQGLGLPVNWDNPGSKHSGSFAPAGNLTLTADTVCRPFRASIVYAPKLPEKRYTGKACRTGPGEWSLEGTPVLEGKMAMPTQPLPTQLMPSKASALALSAPSLPSTGDD